MTSSWHIWPRSRPFAEGALCGAQAPGEHLDDTAGLRPPPAGKALCAACLVLADEMQQEGDLRVVDRHGQPTWELDRRPPEYRSADAFADYLHEDERSEYTPDDLQQLVEHTGTSELVLRRTLGQRGIRPAPEPKQVRGLNSYWKTGDWRVR